jgi:hypothetical protein
MLKKIGLSSAALLAMLICVQPAAVFAQERNDSRSSQRYQNGYSQTEARRAPETQQYQARLENTRRDSRDNEFRNRADQDRDQNWRRYHDDDDGYRYNSYRR